MIRRHRVLLVLCLLGAFGCYGRVPHMVTTGKLKTTYTIDELELQGPTEGVSQRWRVLFISWGERKSFLEAERRALAKTDSDILIDRVRYTGYTGLVLPLGTVVGWLFPGTPAFDVPLVAQENWYAGGVGARFRDPAKRPLRR